MSFLSDIPDGPFRIGPAVEEAESHPFFPVLDALVARMEDGLDHPELWPLVAEAARHEDVALLRGLIAVLRPRQNNRSVLRAFDVIDALIHAIGSDRDEGLAMLGQLAMQHFHCPQVAGATFFARRHGDGERTADLSARFCESPFIRFETLVDGTVAPCRSLWTQLRLGRLDGQDAAAIWNSADAQAMRASILDGSFRYCNKQRCLRILEDSLPLRDEIEDPLFLEILEQGRTELETGPRTIALAHDATCNLACPSCRAGIQAADTAQEHRFTRIEEQVLQPLLASCDGEALLSIAGEGDPWSSPHYRSILRYLADRHLPVRLNLATNGQLMNDDRWASYAGLARYRPIVDVSIDACTPWVYEAVRRPGKWEGLYPNLQFIAGRRRCGEFREFHLNATIQLDNYHEMPALIDLATGLGADSMRLRMVQNTGGHIASHYPRKNIASEDHPLHPAFLETLRDPRLGRPIAHLHDVAMWRQHAIETRLPSDRLGEHYSRVDLGEALIETSARPEDTIALCAAGRIRFPHDRGLLRIEAAALDTLGFVDQARYRRCEAAASESAARPEGQRPLG